LTVPQPSGPGAFLCLYLCGVSRNVYNWISLGFTIDLYYRRYGK
jgi:hypothetical protein